MAARAVTTRKPNFIPPHSHSEADELKPLIINNWIWCPLKSEWRVLLPEEPVRQGYILLLNKKYGYSFEQMDQERRTRHGRKSPKADIVVWGSVESKIQNRAPIIVVECKSDNITIVPDDYEQVDSYARAIGDPCEFLVMHNNKETRYFRIIRGLPGTREDIENIPNLSELNDAARMDSIRQATKAFSREEFRRLLFDCHSILRDIHKMEPGKAFDEISKILFIKMFIERTGNHDKFTVEYLDQYAGIRRRNLEDVMNDLFDDTKRYYQADELFNGDDRLNISFATFRRIVQLLERFNLGATSDDIKGIAFERFLGQTFRGDLGQFFTPRPIVDFVIEFLDPLETTIMCDPASGSGGFLIKHFDYIRYKIEAEVHEAKQAIRAQIELKGYDDDRAAQEITKSFAALNKDLDVAEPNSRLWKVAHLRIFGCDAEPRAARTSKMNMIMHGDGHGGIHHHDGLVDINGIFPGHFDLVVTNPPFGAKVEDDQIVGATDETRIDALEDNIRIYSELYGVEYIQSRERMIRAEQNGETILSLFDISRHAKSEKTEVLFIKRCINLLKPSGRMGIVVPDGILNNPSQSVIRKYIEDRAKILAVISIPDKTFRSAKTNIKASLLFLQRYTEEEEGARRELHARVELAELEKVQARIEQLDKILKIQWSRYENSLDNPNQRARAENLLLALDEYGLELDQETFNTKRNELRLEYNLLTSLPKLIARNAVKHNFDYEIFMAVSEHVGIRASGKEDPINELPNILQAWVKFNKNVNGIDNDVKKSIFRIRWSEIDRWDTISFKPIEWQCDEGILVPLGSVLRQRSEPVDRTEYDFSELTPITIHFNGSIDPRDTSDTDDYTMELFFAKPGNIVLSKIDLKNGAVGIVPLEFENVVVTNHFVVYEPNLELVYPPYLMRLIQTKFFKDYLWRKKVGSEGRKEVKIELFQSTLIPLPSVEIQKGLVNNWTELDNKNRQVLDELRNEEDKLEKSLLSSNR